MGEKRRQLSSTLVSLPVSSPKPIIEKTKANWYYPMSTFLGIDVAKRNEMWALKKEQKIHAKQYEKHIRETDGCTFAPQKYPRSTS